MAKGSKIIQQGIYNMIFCAPTRSGKGVSSVIPTRFSWEFITKFNGSVVVQKDCILQRSFAYHTPDADNKPEAL